MYSLFFTQGFKTNSFCFHPFECVAKLVLDVVSFALEMLFGGTEYDLKISMDTGILGVYLNVHKPGYIILNTLI